MALCPSNCTITLPTPVNACNITTRPGGIGRMLFLKCSVNLTGVNLLDPNVWCAWIANNDLSWSGQIMGEKPEASYSMKQFTSCGAESPTGKTSKINFEDFNADDTSFMDYDFYNTLYSNPRLFYFGWLTCDGLFYGWIGNWSIKVDDVIESMSTESSFWKGEVSYTTFTSIKPFRALFLENVINGGCVTP